MFGRKRKEYRVSYTASTESYDIDGEDSLYPYGDISGQSAASAIASDINKNEDLDEEVEPSGVTIHSISLVR